MSVISGLLKWSESSLSILFLFFLVFSSLCCFRHPLFPHSIHPFTPWRALPRIVPCRALHTADHIRSLQRSFRNPLVFFNPCIHLWLSVPGATRYTLSLSAAPLPLPNSGPSFRLIHLHSSFFSSSFYQLLSIGRYWSMPDWPGTSLGLGSAPVFHLVLASCLSSLVFPFSSSSFFWVLRC